MSILPRMIKEIKNTILKYQNEYTKETLISDIIKDKKITYTDKLLNIEFSTEEILLAFNYFQDRGRYNLVYCISVLEGTEEEKNFDIENLRDEYKLMYDALSLGYTYEKWIEEEQDKYYYREAKKKDSIEFLKKYYPDLKL